MIIFRNDDIVFLEKGNDEYEYYDEEYDSLDLTEGKSKYKWIKIEELDKYKINPKIMKEKLKEDNNELVHFIYREY